MKAFIADIEYYLPENRLINDDLAKIYDGWNAEKIEKKLGVRERPISDETQTASDLAFQAASKLLDKNRVARQSIDGVVLCTQSPDYFLPTTACLLQHRLGLSTGCAAFDFNLGCSGFVYGLSIAKGLIESGQLENILLLTSETYSKYIHPNDKSVRTIFGDGAAAILIQGVSDQTDYIGPFEFGTDGSGAENLIVPAGGHRKRNTDSPPQTTKDDQGNLIRTEENLFMDGPAIYNFTLKQVPVTTRALLEKAQIELSDIDWVVMHQANKHMLTHLRKKINIPEDKFIIDMLDTGNTVSSTIPIILKKMIDQKLLKIGQSILLVGFGVGYSWAATLIKWKGKDQ